jgi:hypothetical protein
MGLNFMPNKAQPGQLGPALVEAHKAQLAPGQMLNIQLVQASASTDGAVAQMFISAK